MVVHDGAVGTGARDRVEAQVAQGTGLLAQRLQPVRDLDLAQRAAARFVRQPAQEAADCGSVAAMGRPDAGQLDVVLAGLGQGHRVGVAHDLDARRLQPGHRPHRGGGAFEQDALSGLAEHVERGREIVGRRQGDAVAEPRHGTVGNLASIHVEVDVTIAVQQGEAKRERRARHVAAPHVQQPGDRIRCRQQGDVGPFAFDDGGDAGALGGAALARELVGMRQHRGERRRRPVRPYGVERVGLDGHELAAGALAGAGEALMAVEGLQPGIEAELAALGQVLGDPRFGWLLGNLVRHEGCRIDLAAHRQGVAAVDEDGCAIDQHDGEACRAAKAGQPGEALCPARHIFALVLVGARDDEAGEATALQFSAQGCQPGWRRGRFVEPGSSTAELCPPAR